MVGAMSDYETPLTPCPWCGYPLDRATPLEEGGNAPEPGDLSLCFNCAQVLVVTEALGMRQATVEEEAELMADAVARRFRDQLRARDRRKVTP